MDTKTLVERCQHGDRESLGLLYSQYSARMMKIIRHYITDSADAGDILHDGFIVAFTQIKSLRDPDKLEYWLGTIMKNLSIQHLNQVELNSLLDEGSDIPDTPEIQELISLEELEAIINLLPDGYRKVFKLAVLENKTHREIGKLLGIAPHSSSSQLFRAKEMLRKIIREHGLELAGAISIFLILLTLSPRIFRNDTPTLTPIANRADERFLAITKPAEETATVSTVHIAGNLTLNHSRHIEPITQDDDKETTTPSTEEHSNGINEPEKAQVPEQSLTPHNPNGNHKPNEPGDFNDISDAEIPDSGKNDKRPTSFGVTFRASGINTLNNFTSANDHFNSGTSSDPTYPGADGPSTVPEESSLIQHSPTISFGITANFGITRTLSVGSGLVYSYLHSKVTTAGVETDYRHHYIGIPLKLNLSLYTSTRLSIYGSAGTTIDFPISSTKKNDKRYDDMPPPQWSISGGIGFQYSITPHIGIYAEPSLRYNFHNSNTEVITKWQDERFEFSLPIGLRFTM